MALVPIPWQPHLFLTPSTLARLELASRYLGRNIIVRGPDGAWRPYAVQKKYYDLFKAGKGNPASNPDTGQRGHLRGASFDAIGVDSATQAACRKAGLTRDAVEAWHWNDPDLYSMPVIMSNFVTAGTIRIPLDTPHTKRKRPPMSTGQVKRAGSDVVYAFDLERIQAPLRAITFAEWRAGAGAGIEVVELEATKFDALFRQRGQLMQDTNLRAVIWNAGINPGAGNDLYNWDGFAVQRPKG